MMANLIQWFKNLTEDNKVKIILAVAAVVFAAIGWFIKEFLFKKKSQSTSPASQTNITQSGTGHKAVTSDGSGNRIQVVERIEQQGVDTELVLRQLIEITEDKGQLKAEKQALIEKVKRLENELSKPQVEEGVGEQRVVTVTAEAKALAGQIDDDDGLYARALKAIAEGRNDEAQRLLDEAQRGLDTIQQEKDKAQVKIYMAQMQNAAYGGNYLEALEWARKLEPLAGDDAKVLNEIALIFKTNGDFQTAEPLYERALKIDEKVYGQEYPHVATILNNLAQLYQATNRRAKAEPLMERALTINEKAYGKDHPDVARVLSNLAQLYKVTNRLAEAEPLYERALGICERSLGTEHPKTVTVRKNLESLREEK